ncbi:MAG: hypothetical protein U5L04_01555 [Trueperaceae bacterium]|nr:hypothetical protein [Trueperaceae bacterium]
MLTFESKGQTHRIQDAVVRAYVDDLIGFAKRVWMKAGKTRAWRANQRVSAQAYRIARGVGCEVLGSLMTVECLRTQADDGSWRYALEPKLKNGVRLFDEGGNPVDLPL